MDNTGTKDQQFPCAQCGAILKFKPGSDSIVCEYCGHTQAVTIPTGASNSAGGAAGEIKEYDFNDAVKNAKKLSTSEIVTGSKEMQCNGCGAISIITDQSTQCSFCGSPMVTEAKPGETMFAPESVLPFKVDRKDAKQKFMDWVKGLWFAPSDLSKRAQSTGMDGVYLPYWTYDSDTTTRYTGQRGEWYYVNETYTNSKGETETRSVKKTNWYPAAGTVYVNFDDELVCASKSLPHEMIDELEPWDLKELKPYDARFLAGFVTERYKIGLEEGFSIFKEKVSGRIYSAITKDIGGDEQRVLTQSSSYNNVKFKHLLLPLWISSYRYNEKVYRFVINARTGEVAGDRPYSWIKITLAVLGAIAVGGLFYYFFGKPV